jgi:hypothetical protein
LYFLGSFRFNAIKFIASRITSYDKINESIYTSAFLCRYYGKMEDENLDNKKYIPEKLDINFD